MIFVMQSFSQPARLNVFKNDQDTWDYTNPNLSGQGNTQSPVLPSPFFFLFSSHATVWDGQGSLPPGVLLLIRVECFFQLSDQRQYPCDAFTIFMHFSTTQQAQSKGMRSNLEGSQPQLKAHACEKPNAHPSQQMQAHHSSHRFTFPQEHVTAAQPHIPAYSYTGDTTETITPVSILSNIVEILS